MSVEDKKLNKLSQIVAQQEINQLMPKIHEA